MESGNASKTFFHEAFPFPGLVLGKALGSNSLDLAISSSQIFAPILTINPLFFLPRFSGLHYQFLTILGISSLCSETHSFGYDSYFVHFISFLSLPTPPVLSTIVTNA
ncbi:hypothetical protein OCU04_012041 [Sclerotinia nivalis]|uniref:Uncharacterized protein n=1 Tax=Sclerotinia nivalis TaxID=352851 RepID=A0A9X0AAX0_9HELO|nr:hypothetical protein OCU04_012041 [Sclerotinia nivalis]